jgi:HK97 gp10 family phage protein
MDMHFDMSSLNALAQKYEGADGVVRDEVRKGITRSVIQIEADAKRLVPTDTHHLQRSLTHEVTASGRDVTGRAGSNVNYARFVEEGRRPGRMPPPAALEGWARRKTGSISAAFLIARAIGRRGTRPQPYLKPALDRNRQAIGREMGVAVPKRILARLKAGR